MLSYLPKLYERSRVVEDLLQAEGAEFDELRKALDQILDQAFVRTATWGLDRWEQELGLTVATWQSTTERRDRLASHLRGYGTATISIVKAVAQAYDQGTVDVVQDHPHYRVILHFVDTRGVPTNLSDLQKAVRAIVPAHLEVVYEFRYTTWDEVDSRGWTWDALDALGLTWDEFETHE